jgi:TP901 family phage tail tape measure protein
LTDIRIVTGYSADKMADFAKEANKAAKSLGTTTNEYAKASLIYFQQGLSDAEVKERTDVTIKMANVSRESAEVVSDQMTAVWNNFADGSRTLEYYADVMTALGAATASSTAEITTGLEKFAAVAETVGLSYEYATTALATITDTTRQSADVVGNALKTLFARIQGLSLGETLEDGTDLTKYSEALMKVGISIKE